ncbi:MAG: hypothetical protein H0X66_09295 [Verrucomicrobia bacterium]|nr:hypothetical protein [Verrucomicrobiota bacterium]
MFAERLKEELNTMAPEWEWSCANETGKSPDLISPKLLSVSATNKASGASTSSIQVSNTPTADVRQAAQFICDVLMIAPPDPALPGSAVFQRPG